MKSTNGKINIVILPSQVDYIIDTLPHEVNRDNYHVVDFFVNVSLMTKLLAYFFIWPLTSKIFMKFNYLRNKWMDIVFRNIPKFQKVVFIIYEKSPFLEYHFINYINQNWPGSEKILYINDYLNTPYSNNLLEKFNNIATFDSNNSIRFNYYHLITGYRRPYNFVANHEIDVLYVGNEKSRLKKLLKLHDILSSININCLLIINNSPIKVSRKGIIYDKFLSYKQYLRLVTKSRIILELGVIEQSSPTLRYFEAIEYNKYLITDINYSDIYYESIPSEMLIQLNDRDFLKKVLKSITTPINPYNIGSTNKFDTTVFIEQMIYELIARE
jgi:hypothetical protein